MSDQTNGGKIIAIIAIVVLLLAGAIAGWYGFVYKPKQEAMEKARQEQLAREEAAKKAVEQAAKDEARYKQLIEEGDRAFELEYWETARTKYMEASNLFPDQKHPKDQLALVNARLDELAVQQTAGVVRTVSAPTGRYYITISSSIDDDLAMDYANKLAKEGNSIKIIEHDDGQHLYYRVSLGDYASQAEAEAAVPSFSPYGEGVWVLRY